jgi:hypothetical protein
MKRLTGPVATTIVDGTRYRTNNLLMNVVGVIRRQSGTLAPAQHGRAVQQKQPLPCLIVLLLQPVQQTGRNGWLIPTQRIDMGCHAQPFHSSSTCQGSSPGNRGWCSAWFTGG